MENTRLVVWQVGKHVSFIPETGALGMEKVEFEDSGDYLCVINNKRDNGLVRLFVQGRCFLLICSEFISKQVKHTQAQKHLNLIS